MMRKNVLVLLVASIILCGFERGVRADAYFYDDFSDGDVSNYGCISDPSDPCYTCGEYFVDGADYVTGPYSLRFDMDNHPDNQDPCSYVSASLNQTIQEGNTVYLAFYTKFSANHYWDDDEFNKHLEIRGSPSSNARLLFNIGRWEVGQLQGMGLYSSDTYKALPFLGTVNGGEVWRPYNSPDGVSFIQNLDMENPVYCETGEWYSIVIRADMVSSRNGTLEMWVNGIKVIEQHQVRTTIDGTPYATTFMGGTHNQPTYDVGINSTKSYDDYLITDSWQDIVDGGYLTDPEANNPPTRANPFPTGILPTGTTSANISLTTDKQAVCRYSNNSGTNYTNMPYNFTYTNLTNHSTQISGLENGNTYIYYIRCNSTDGFVNTDDFNITFSVDGHKADLNDDGVISMRELIAYIARWKANDRVTKVEVLEARDIWFAGGVY
ncbi:MAG: hypothetical protein U9M95_04155 [Candidatus Altiarchaeota archaeon]|nr:hypothetical protein [Candidatus Altiarchaeota archaeon]